MSILAIDKSNFLVLTNTKTGYQMFEASDKFTLLKEISSLRFRKVKRGSFQVMESLNLTLNNSSTSEIARTAQTSTSNCITTLP